MLERSKFESCNLDILQKQNFKISTEKETK
jgi:hypothetical protein